MSCWPRHVSRLKVMDEAASGKLYTRGHDRQGRAVIYFTPGLESSFDTEKVGRTLRLCWPIGEAAASWTPRRCVIARVPVVAYS